MAYLVNTRRGNRLAKTKPSCLIFRNCCDHISKRLHYTPIYSVHLCLMQEAHLAIKAVTDFTAWFVGSVQGFQATSAASNPPD